MNTEPQTVRYKFIHVKKDKIFLPIYVQPNAKKSEWCGVFNQMLKLRVASPPVDNAANKELIKFIAKYFDISKSKVVIIKGSNSRNKIVEIPFKTEIIETLNSID